MPHRIAIAAEGRSDCAVLETICRRAGFSVRVAAAQGKGDLFKSFDKILKVLDVRFQPTHHLVVADLQPQLACPEEADRWRKEIKRRFPKAQLCLCIWELEAWLLADPNAVSTVLNKTGFKHEDPDRVGDPKPSTMLETLYRERFGYEHGAAYHKEADGKVLAEALDLNLAAAASPSLAHFLGTLRARQEQLHA